MRVKLPGNINAADMALCRDKDRNVIAHCIDTPNSIAYALGKNKKIDTIETRWSGTISRKEFEKKEMDRVENMGWFKYDVEAFYREV